MEIIDSVENAPGQITQAQAVVVKGHGRKIRHTPGTTLQKALRERSQVLLQEKLLGKNISDIVDMAGQKYKMNSDGWRKIVAY